MKDPTKAEMEAFLACMVSDGGSVVDDPDLQGAIWWFAVDHHTGQGSNLYSAMSVSRYKPGALEVGASHDMMADAYNALIEEYGP